MAMFRFPKRKLRKLIQQGEYTDAIEFGKSLESKFANDSDYLFIMGSLFYILEDAKQSLHYLDRSLAITKTDIETLHLKANVHIHLKEHEIALECCKKILTQDPEHQESKQIVDALED